MSTEKLCSRGPRASRRRMAPVASLLLIAATPAMGTPVEVTLFIDGDEWRSAVNHNYTTIDFTGGENFTFINDDYAHLGVTFGPNAHYFNTTGFPNDHWGMRAIGGAYITFDTPQRWIGADHPGNVIFDLYYQGEKFYSSVDLFLGFSGLISSHDFDMVHLRQHPENTVSIDDLHFGVPAPGALGLLLIAGWIGPRRRRR